ncbi:MAG: TlpA disulfide reductase family protein [Gammaproteobacteria bacterium]
MKNILRIASSILLLVVMNSAIADDFKLNDLNGKSHNLSDYKGKWVIVNYWATWCPPCLDELPELVDFHEDHKNKDAVVLGINYEDVDHKYLKEFVDQYFISYPILHADPGQADFWGPINGLPTTFIISPKGEMVLRQVGRVDGQFLENAIHSKSKHVSSK